VAPWLFSFGYEKMYWIMLEMNGMMSPFQFMVSFVIYGDDIFSLSYFSVMLTRYLVE
jgi:hypothetical protein